MVLINLELIKSLTWEAHLSRHMAESLVYNNANDVEIDATTFRSMIKAGFQAQSLCDQLQALFNECSDFIAGNYQKYIDAQGEYMEEFDETTFNPWDVLDFHFYGGGIDDLPQRIEQYVELCAVAAQFSVIRSKRDEATAALFGGIVPMRYVGTDEDGETILVPASEMPQDILDEVSANKEIASVETEYCLDGYNQFYTEVVALIKKHKKTGQNEQCAREILALYK